MGRAFRTARVPQRPSLRHMSPWQIYYSQIRLSSTSGWILVSVNKNEMHLLTEASTSFLLFKGHFNLYTWNSTWDMSRRHLEAGVKG